MKNAKTLEDLRKYKFGTLVNSSYATYITDVIKPEQGTLRLQHERRGDPGAGQRPDRYPQRRVLQIAIEVTTDQFPNLDIVGILPGPGTELGMVFEKDSPLVPFVGTLWPT
ncbi:MAG: hypothetical protein U0075_10135 [Thermomicrobiales bacterium]